MWAIIIGGMVMVEVEWVGRVRCQIYLHYFTVLLFFCKVPFSHLPMIY